MSGKEKAVHVEFRLWHLQPSEEYEPVLVGSHSKLGAWNVYEGRRTYYNDRLDFWSAMATLPPNTTFEYKWVLVDNRGEPLRWETCTNRVVDVETVGGRVDCDWNKRHHFYQDECVMFAITNYKTTDRSDALAVVGSSTALGQWNPKCSVVAVEYPVGSGWWVARVPLPKRVAVEWKWAVLDGNMNAKVWEERENRTFESTEDLVEVTAMWNGETTEKSEPNTEHLYSIYTDGLEVASTFTTMHRWGY